jgi:hypothetical protein
MPVPVVHFKDHANDIAMRNHAYKTGTAVYQSLGSRLAFPTERPHHRIQAASNIERRREDSTPNSYYRNDNAPPRTGGCDVAD